MARRANLLSPVFCLLELTVLLELVRSTVASIDSRDVRHPDPELPVWQIVMPGLLARDRRQRRTVIGEAKRQILRDLVGAAPAAYIIHSDSPTENEVTGFWIQEAERTWRLPVRLDFEDAELAYWLFSLGNWTIYVGDEPIPDWRRASLSDPAALLQWMQANRVSAMVSSGPDDSEWVVALNAERIG